MVDLQGRSVCITGTLSCVRADFEKQLRAIGARPENRVTRYTDVLIIGDKPGATKLRAARQWGTPIIDEAQALHAIHSAYTGQRGESVLTEMLRNMS